MKRILILCAVITFFASCAKDNIDTGVSNTEIKQDNVILTVDEFASIAYDNPRELSEKEIFEIADDFINASADNKGTRSSANYSCKVLSKEYLSSNSIVTRSTDATAPKDIPVYEVLVENGAHDPSYLMISADERSADVIAYLPNVPRSNQDLQRGKMQPNFMALMAMAKSKLLEDVKVIEDNRIALRDQTIEKVCKELNIPTQEYSWDAVKDAIGIKTDKGTTRADDIIYSPIGGRQVIYWRRPLIRIAWDQYAPYNKFCPQDQCSYMFGTPEWMNVPAGCAVIAMVQLESYLSRNIVGGYYINWPYVTAGPYLIESVEGQSGVGDPVDKINMAARVIAGIYREMGAESKRDANNAVYATSVYTYKISNYLDAYTNHTDEQRFNADAVMRSLNEGKPIYLYGNLNYRYVDDPDQSWKTAGHAFLIDGYLAMKRAPSYGTRALVRMFDVYWHVNLGWGPSSSAYFKLSPDATCTINFEDDFSRQTIISIENQQVFTNISRK